MGTDASGRIVAAAHDCIAATGVSRLTVEDLAGAAGCSRATVYRAFPGGKDAVVAQLVAVTTERILAAIDARLEAADGLEDALVGVITTAANMLSDDAALQFVLAHEPDVILPHFAFARLETLLGRTAALVGPRLGRWLPPEEADRAAEWASRLFLSYLICPSPDVEMTDEASVRDLARRFLVPALVGAGPSQPITRR